MDQGEQALALIDAERVLRHRCAELLGRGDVEAIVDTGIHTRQSGLRQLIRQVEREITFSAPRFETTLRDADRD